MHKKDVKYTIDIFKKIYNDLPPFFPKKTRAEIEETLNEIETNYDLSREEVEDIFLKFGKIVWPYFQAFYEIHDHYEKKMFDKLLEQKVDVELKKKLNLYKELGVDKKDLILGSLHSFLDLDEKTKLTKIILELKKDIKHFVSHTILHKEEKKYKTKIKKYLEIMLEITEIILELKELFKKENFKETNLHEDLKDKIKTIENSFLFLAPKTDLEEIKKLKEYYLGKLDEKKYN